MLGIFEKLDRHTRVGLTRIVEDYVGIDYQKTCLELQTMCARYIQPCEKMLIDAINYGEFHLAQYIADAFDYQQTSEHTCLKYAPYIDLVNNHPHLFRTLILQGLLLDHECCSCRPDIYNTMYNTRPENYLRNLLIFYEHYKENTNRKFSQIVELVFKAEYVDISKFVDALDPNDVILFRELVDFRSTIPPIKNNQYAGWLDYERRKK
jgi:hypothetical protein